MKRLGKISETEFEEVKELFTRKSALCEVGQCINRCEELGIDMSAEVLAEQIQKDMNEVGTELIAWWEKIANKYQWDYQKGDQWRVEYATKEVFLL